MQEMKFGPPTAREHLLRPQSGQKMKLKEKFVEIYDTFLRVWISTSRDTPLRVMEETLTSSSKKSATPQRTSDST